MYRKKFIFLLIVILFLSGCTKITDNLDDVVSATMTNDKVSVNTVSTGYELYVPTGVEQVSDNEYNQKFKIKDRYVYLYVDTVSYYYKNMLNYKSNNDYNYYYKELNIDGKTGYIGVIKQDDGLYFCEVVYNYSKMEFYADERELPVILANVLIIQKSIKYNDNLISIELKSNISDGREITYELDSPKDSESNFDAVLREYVVEEEPEIVLPGDNG